MQSCYVRKSAENLNKLTCLALPYELFFPVYFLPCLFTNLVNSHSIVAVLFIRKANTGKLLSTITSYTRSTKNVLKS